VLTVLTANFGLYQSRSVFCRNSFSDGLPVQATEGVFHDANLPPQHQFKRINLPRHSEGGMVTRSHHLQSPLVSLLFVVWSESRWPFGSRDSSIIQDRPWQVWPGGSGMYQEVRDPFVKNFCSIYNITQKYSKRLQLPITNCVMYITPKNVYSSSYRDANLLFMN